MDAGDTLRAWSSRYVRVVLRRCANNKRRACDVLGITYHTLQAHLRHRAPGLTVGQVLEKFAAIQMLDVHFPTTDGRELIFTRYTQPEPDQQLLLGQLGWTLPSQPPPRITAKRAVQM